MCEKLQKSRDLVPLHKDTKNKLISQAKKLKIHVTLGTNFPEQKKKHRQIIYQ